MSGKKTNYQCNKFLTLLMGQCWHEWKKIYLTNNHTVNSNPTLVCKYCDIDRVGNDNPDHLANPLPVIRWMEKEVPEVWEEYLEFRFHLVHSDIDSYAKDISGILDLRNLVRWLIENPTWGEEICTENNRPLDCCQDRDECKLQVKTYDGKSCLGKIIHPALAYASLFCWINLKS